MSVTRDNLKQLKLCQVGVTNGEGAPAACYQLATMPVRLGQVKVQACTYHANALKMARELSMQRAKEAN